MDRVVLAILDDDISPGTDPGENGPWLARLLELRGWSVLAMQSMPETEQDLRGFLQGWAGRSEWLVVSCRRPVEESQKLLSTIADMLQIPFPADGTKKSLVEGGGQIVSCPESALTGLRFSLRGSRVLVLPGEAGAFRSLARSFFAPESVAGESSVLKVVGLSPRQVRDRLPGLPSGDNGLPLSMTLSPNIVTLFLKGPEAEISGYADSLRALFAGDILPPGADSLAQAVLQRSIKAGVTLSAAESCTGGLIGAELTGPAGASASFLGSAVCYANEAKEDVLGVPRSVIETEGAVSEACALAMARGARRIYRSGLSVSVTGIAGPDGGSRQKPVGTVWFGISSESGDRAFVRCFRNMGRNGVRSWTVAVALEALWRHLEGGKALC